MCGLTGFLDTRPQADRRAFAGIVSAMTDTLRHRGPDDAGVWTEEAAGIALGHRRLSIIDLSPLGHQPMLSANGRYVIVFNGEIYNYQDLAAELRRGGATFRGQSDTEVILEGIAAWGFVPTLERLIGMFAIAVWDRQERVLMLARDQLGIKPLYWSDRDGLVLFGSELKALRAHPAWAGEIDRGALMAYLRLAYVPGPHSIYRHAKKLQPGGWLIKRPDRPAELGTYWDMRAAARAGLADRARYDDREATDRLDALLRDSVRRQMVADVPLGAFLSGGIDSSTVVALMQAESARPVRTFTIGFRERAYDEARHARAVAAHLGTDHTELYVEPGHALEVIPRLPEWFDEPFADPSQIPTFMVAELTRRQVTVALSGDGGDELFAGYDRYARAARLWNRIGRVPRPVGRMLAGGLTALSRPAWDGVFRRLPLPGRSRFHGDRMHKLAALLTQPTPDPLYLQLVSRWERPEALVPGAAEAPTPLFDPTVPADIPDFIERMLFLDTVTYLPEDILTKVDRTSMAVALESRVPLLDHRVVEFAWTLPLRFKLRDGGTKWLLRQVLYRYVPPALIDRPKMGFAVPVAAWLRGELRDWAEDLLDERRLGQDGLLDPRPIRTAWAEHLSGRRNWENPLWAVLMLQSWRRREHNEAATRPARERARVAG